MNIASLPFRYQGRPIVTKQGLWQTIITTIFTAMGAARCLMFLAVACESTQAFQKDSR
jgi:hypothetical protein